LLLDPKPDEKVDACVESQVVVQKDEGRARKWVAAADRARVEMGRGGFGAVGGKKCEEGICATNGLADEEPVVRTVVDVKNGSIPRQ
jgi:hypothetical protein